MFKSTHMFIKASIILFCTWFLCDLGRAQEVEFERFTERDGLSHTGIICITQDAQGHLWIGTRNGGLHKYDGYTFTVFQNEPEDTTSISSNWIETLFVDHAGTLWVGTNGQGGLNRYDPQTESFVRYMYNSENANSLIDNRVQVIYEAPSEPGILWVGTEHGLVRFDTEKEMMVSFTHDPLDEKSLSYNHVRAIYEDQRGTLWIGTGGYALEHEGKGGLNRFDRTSGHFRRYVHDPLDENSLIDNRVDVLYEDNFGTFWVGTRGDGLHQFDVLNEKFHRFAFSTNHESLPSKPHLINRAVDPYEGVSFILEDRWGHLWIGGWKGGLNHFDRASNRQYHFENDVRDPLSLIDNNVLCAYEDLQGTLWIGTWSGLHKVVRKRLHFQVYEHDPLDRTTLSKGNIASLTEDGQGMIWMPKYNGDWGLDLLDPSTGMSRHVHRNPLEPQSLSSDTIRVVFKDSQDRMWLGTEGGGLNVYNGGTDSFTHFRHDPSDPTSILSDTVLAIAEGHPGILWIGTSKGINRLDTREETFSFYVIPNEASYHRSATSVTDIHVDQTGHVWFTTENQSIYQIDSTLTISPRSLIPIHGSDSERPGTLSEIHEDAEGTIWLARSSAHSSSAVEFAHVPTEHGTNNGLLRYDPGLKRFVSVLPNLPIHFIYEGNKGRLWLATDIGLHVFNPETGETEAYTTDKGLVNNKVYSIVQDTEGFIWIGTESGMSRFDPTSGAFSNFYREDGMPRRTFRMRGSIKSTDNMLYFALVDNSQGALISFSPSDNFVNTLPPNVAFTNLFISNALVKPGPNRPLHTSFTHTDNIVLRAQEKSFAIEFAALHFERPHENTYRYILEGFDEEWIESGTGRIARYPLPSPGAYTFKVDAASGEGVWADEIASIGVVVLPPWYRTWWAFLLFGSFFVASVFLANRFQRNRLITQERIRAEREKAKAIESTNNDLQRALKHLTETQDQLIHTEKMASLGQLTAGVAHEIKNPLNFVNNFASVAEEQIEEIEEIFNREEKNFNLDSTIELHEIIDDLKVSAMKIKEHGQRADGIIRSMLEHSRTGRGKRRSVQPNKLVEDYVNLAYHGIRAREDGIEVELETLLDDTISEINLYPQELGRVLINLFENAFYTVNEKRLLADGLYIPKVSVSTKNCDGYFEIRVEDNGLGIPEHIQERIFEPFFTTKPTGSGTGLGLSLSYDIIVKGHGGALTVKSEENEGSTFIVRIPHAE